MTSTSLCGLHLPGTFLQIDEILLKKKMLLKLQLPEPK